MSFICRHCNQLVTHTERVLVPSIKRIVRYQKMSIPTKWDKETKTIGDAVVGWELVKEVPVCENHAIDYLAANQPQIIDTGKTIYIEVYQERKFERPVFDKYSQFK